MSSQAVKSPCRTGNELDGFFDWLDRKCRLAMKIGGGGLCKDVPNPVMNPQQRGRILKLYSETHSVEKVSELTGWSPNTVYRITRELRKAKARGSRGPYIKP